MNPEIRFERKQMKRGKLGEKSSVPDLLGGLILQNQLKFHLGEEDEIYEGYGRCKSSYPYRQYSCYLRELEEGSVKTVILENDFLEAVFLPELGGRLWSLTDKKTGRNLLYTNDVLRFSNLAVRNAWFSGGAEWNIGVIGHSPFTTAPLYAGVLKDKDGTPVLRMYEYERIREVTYQMDFWLGEQDRFLNARMRIVNSSDQVVPMYWWSNIAVPEHENGRIIVPAKMAYTVQNREVCKVDIPFVNGTDITAYKNIPASADYFFEIPKEEPKYIAHVDENGYGLLHFSTSRLQSRKLFSWGNRQGAGHWQEFLTKDAGRYVEIQAGLGKTQYGCLPMAPHTAWEWIERYGSIQLEPGEQFESFQNLRAKVTKRVLHETAFQEMEQVLQDTRQLAKEKAEVFQKGSGYGALKNAVRAHEGDIPVSGHLDFEVCEKELNLWQDFLKTGKLAEVDETCQPGYFMSDPALFEKLKESMAGANSENWYAHYQLGLYYFQKEKYKKAGTAFHKSLEIRENPWAYHGVASVYTVLEEKEEAKKAIRSGILLRSQDLSYLKEGFRILSLCEGAKEILELYQGLDCKYQRNGRLKFYYIQALGETGEFQRAYDLLCADGGLAVEDIREGELSLGDVWKKLYKKLYGEEGELPYCFDFTAS